MMGRAAHARAASLFFFPWPPAAWQAVRLVGLGTHLRSVEEPNPERRFGDDYLRYKARVPRWAVGSPRE